MSPKRSSCSLRNHLERSGGHHRNLRHARRLARVLGLFTAFALVGAGAATAAAPRTWTGAAGNGEWSEPRNWREGAVPGSGDLAVLTGGDSVTFDGHGIAGLVLTPAFTGVLRLERDLVVTGTLEVAGGTLDQGAGAVDAAVFYQRGGRVLGGTAPLTVAGEIHVVAGELLMPGAMVRAERLEVYGRGVVRMGDGTRVELTGDGQPLVGDGLLDTTTHSPNSIELTGPASTGISPSGPLVAMHGLRPASALGSGGGFSQAGDSLVLRGGEHTLTSAVIDTAAGFAYFGTYTSPGIVVKVRLSDLTRVGALTLQPGEDFINTAVIDPAAGFAYFTTDTAPGNIVKVRLGDFARVGSLTLGSTDGYLSCAVIDPGGGLAYFGTTGTLPAKVVKVRLSDLTRVATLALERTDGQPSCAVVDAGAGFAYFGTTADLATVVKVRLADFSRVAALALDAADGWLCCAVIDAVGGFAYFGTRGAFGVGQGSVVKVRLTDLTRVGAVRLSQVLEYDADAACAVIDPAGGFAYFVASGYPFHSVVKLRLSDLSRAATLDLEDDVLCAVIDPVRGFAYFGTTGYPARVVQARLTDLLRTGSLTLDAGEDHLVSGVIDPLAGFAYFGTSTSPAMVVKVRLSDFARVGGLTLAPGEGNLTAAVIDPLGGFAYFGSSFDGSEASPAAVVVEVRLSDFTRAGALTLSSGDMYVLSAVIDPAAGFAYFGTACGSVCAGRIVKVSLSDFTWVGTLTLNADEQGLHSAVIDPAAGFVYFGTGGIPAKLVKVRLSDFARIGALTLPEDKGRVLSAVIDTAAGFGYLGADPGLFSPGVILKVRLSDLTRVGALSLASHEASPACAVIDPAGGYAYFGTSMVAEGTVVKVRLSDLARVMALPLDMTMDVHSSAGTFLSAAVADPANGFAYFATDTSAARVARIDLGSTSVELAASQSPVPAGQPVTFTAAIRAVHPGASAPQGRVTFTSDGTTIVGCTGLVATAGQAACTTSFQVDGTYTIGAAFTADAGWSNSAASVAQEIHAREPRARRHVPRP